MGVEVVGVDLPWGRAGAPSAPSGPFGARSPRAHPRHAPRPGGSDCGGGGGGSGPGPRARRLARGPAGPSYAMARSHSDPRRPVPPPRARREGWSAAAEPERSFARAGSLRPTFLQGPSTSPSSGSAPPAAPCEPGPRPTPRRPLRTLAPLGTGLPLPRPWRRPKPSAKPRPNLAPPLLFGPSPSGGRSLDPESTSLLWPPGKP